MSISVEAETITPTEAAALLRKSEGQPQRALSDLLVRKLAHAIEAGDWLLTHQGIALDDAGVVLDGQHRLHAIVLADTPVQIMVARGVDPAGFGVFDTGRSRTTGDALRIAGYGSGAHLAAAARYLLAYDDVVGTTERLRAHTRLISSTDVLHLMESDRGNSLMQAYHVADRVAGHGWSRTGFRTWVTAAIVVLTEGPPSHELVLEFCERMYDGANLSPGSPILALRRYCMSDGGLIRTAHGIRGDVGIAVTIKAFNAWNAGTVRELMVFRSGVEAMPAVEAVMPGGILAN